MKSRLFHFLITALILLTWTYWFILRKMLQVQISHYIEHELLLDPSISRNISREVFLRFDKLEVVMNVFFVLLLAVVAIGFFRIRRLQTLLKLADS